VIVARSLAVLLWTTCAATQAGAAAAEPAPVRLEGGFAARSMERWVYVRADLRAPDGRAAEGRLSLRFASGRMREVALPVPAGGHVSRCEYAYEGASDVLESAELVLGDVRRTWSRPDTIPPARPAVVITADEGRFMRVEALLSSRYGVDVLRVAPDALPDRWVAWSGQLAVVGWADELPAAATTEGRALDGYLRAGGTVFQYGLSGEGDLFAGLPAGALEGRGGRLIRPAQGSRYPASLPDPPGAPQEARALGRPAVAPPAGWLGWRALWFLPCVFAGLWLVSRQPRRGALIMLLLAVGVTLAPVPPPRPVDIQRLAWHDGHGYTWIEVLAIPGRSGRMVLPTPPELDVAVYALDPGTELDLEWDAQHGHAVSARWGEPLRLLVEGVARAD